MQPPALGHGLQDTLWVGKLPDSIVYCGDHQNAAVHGEGLWHSRRYILIYQSGDFSVFCCSSVKVKSGITCLPLHLCTPWEMRQGLWMWLLRYSRCESLVLRCLPACRSGADSSAGLAGWILEKLYAWTDCHGSVEQSLSKEVGGASAQSTCKQ